MLLAGYMKVLGGPYVARGPDVAQAWSRGLQTFSSTAPDSHDWVTWIVRLLLQDKTWEKYCEKNQIIQSGADAIKKFTPSLGIPYLGVQNPRQELGVKFGNHLSLLSLGS